MKKCEKIKNKISSQMNLQNAINKRKKRAINSKRRGKWGEPKHLLIIGQNSIKKERK